MNTTPGSGPVLENDFLCVWSADYKVGIRKMDEQHRALFAAVGRLYKLLLQHGDIEEIDRAYSELIRLAQIHFKTEEAFMRNRNYPDYRCHKEMHEALLTQVGDLHAAERELHSLDVRRRWEERLETADFLSAWLVEHIIDEDKPLGVFLKSAGEE